MPSTGKKKTASQRKSHDDHEAMNDDPTQPKRGGRRDSVVDRRSGVDRRGVGLETNLERRRGPGRRRTDFLRAADEGEMTKEQFLFVMAIDSFKQVNNKTFPSWTDVLEVIRKLGYRKTMPSELNLGNRVEDWTERADSPAGVFKISEGDDPERAGDALRPA